MGHAIIAPYDSNKNVIENPGPGKAFPGSPTYMPRGKTIPDLVTCSKKSSITSNILRTAFERLDKLQVYGRKERITPMVLDWPGSSLFRRVCVRSCACAGGC